MHDLPIFDIRFDSIFNMFYKIYEVIWTSGYLIWVWLSEPVDPAISELFPELGVSSNLELIFGSALIAVLIYAVAKFFNPLS